MNQTRNLRQIGKTGDITRRHFFQIITSAAVAASFPERALSGPVFKPIWLSQYTYVAPDMKKTADWYKDVFGMQQGATTREDTHLWFGDVQGDTLMIVRQANSGENVPALTRFGFTINYWNKDLVRLELESRDLNPQPEGDGGFWFHDPEGNEIGVFASDWMTRPAPLESRHVPLQALSANHIVVVSSDYKQLASWYHSLFAFNQTTDSGRDVVQWFGDSAWLPTQVREGQQTSGMLKTFDHCAITVADYDVRKIVPAMKRYGMISQDRMIEDDDTGIYGVDLNGFKIQVCSWKEAPNQDRRRMRRSQQ